jgi:uncharacterized repeat protein (TIGR03803 family)
MKKPYKSRLIKSLYVIPIYLGICLLSCNTVQAQPELWGITQYGGETQSGVIFKTDINGQNLQKMYSFDQYVGRSCQGHVVEGEDGKLYGLTEAGGLYNSGVLFEYDFSSSKYKVLFEFDGDNGSTPMGSPIIAADGKLYGTTTSGGNNGAGVIFEYDIDAGSYLVRVHLDPTYHGSGPYGQLFQAVNGKLYGTTRQGGINNQGTMYEYNLETSLFTKKVDFEDYDKGAYPMCGVVQAANGKLYGVTTEGGIMDDGVLYSYDLNTSTYTKHVDFQPELTGSNPRGRLLVGPDNNLYGMSCWGANTGNGAIYMYSPLSNIMTMQHSFDVASDGSLAFGGLIDGGDGWFYGHNHQGGVGNSGTLFKYDPVTNVVIKLVDIYGVSYGAYPVNELCLASNGRMYGITTAGGKASFGTLYEYDPVSLNFSKRIDFDHSVNGAKPWGGLTLYADDQLFGITSRGGNGLGGVIFEFNPSNSTYTVRYELDYYTEGGSVFGPMLKASNGMLYGMTHYGGENSDGVLYEFNPLVDTYTVLFDFGGSAYGENPYGGLIEASDGKLYGMTYDGGTNNSGAIFSYDLSGSIYTKLFDFSSSYGEMPHGSLAQASNGKLYGMTNEGGSFDNGVLFEYDPATFTYEVKVHFDGTNRGEKPSGNLIEVDGLLYGLTSSGGVFDNGVLFTYDPASGTFTKKVDINQEDHGSYPDGTLFEASNGKLYGVTNYGGTHLGGVVFSYDISTNTLLKTAEFTGPDGRFPRRGFLIEVMETGGIPEDDEGSVRLSVAPNPTSGKVSVGYRMQDAGYGILTIMDLRGKELMELVKEHEIPGEHQIDLNLENLPAGVYLIRLIMGNKSVTKKLVVSD